MASYTVRFCPSITGLPRDAWDDLVGAESPFLEWDWLASLEEAGCLVPERGWQPQHLVLERDGRLVGACPLYVKGNSEGEFVFDHAWAHAALRAGLDYYPKLLVAVPFTPATGARFLTAPGEPRPALIQAMGRALLELCREAGVSSLHINFCRDDEVEALAGLGFLERVGLQYHWENRDYGTFEDYLAGFRSKRRTKIRRERREMADRAIRIRPLAGEAIADELLPQMYRLYEGHILSLYWGRLYLNERFFRLLGERFKRNLCLVVAEREGRLIAGTFNVQKGEAFYGRYWGAFEEYPTLHFNVCYYAAIEHCIGRGLRRFEPGAGGSFKQLRGFDPRPTHSMHHFTHPELHRAVGDFLAQERRQMREAMERLNGMSQLRGAGTG